MSQTDAETPGAPEAEPAPAPLSTEDAQVVVDPQAARPATANARAHVLSATLLAVGGTPLVSQSVQIIDPQTGQPVGDPVTTDEAGHLDAEVPDDRAYALRILDDDRSCVAPPEQAAPFDQAATDAVHLYLRVLGKDGTGRGGQAYELSGPEGAHYSGVTDADGDIEVIGCPAGPYRLIVGGRYYTVHTLYESDLAEDPTPYDVRTEIP